MLGEKWAQVSEVLSVQYQMLFNENQQKPRSLILLNLLFDYLMN